MVTPLDQVFHHFRQTSGFNLLPETRIRPVCSPALSLISFFIVLINTILFNCFEKENAQTDQLDPFVHLYHVSVPWQICLFSTSFL